MRPPDISGARAGPQRSTGCKSLCLNPPPARRVIRVAPLASGGAHAPAFAAMSADSGGAGGDGAALTVSSPVDIPGRGARRGARDFRCGHGACCAQVAARVSRALAHRMAAGKSLPALSVLNSWHGQHSFLAMNGKCAISG